EKLQKSGTRRTARARMARGKRAQLEEAITVSRLEGSLQATRLTLQTIYYRLYEIVPARMRPKFARVFKFVIAKLKGISRHLCRAHPDIPFGTEARLSAILKRAQRRVARAGGRNRWVSPPPL